MSCYIASDSFCILSISNRIFTNEKNRYKWINSFHQSLLSPFCCSVVLSCLTLCDRIHCSLPGSSVLHCLPLKLMSTESMMSCSHLILCHLLLLLPSILPSIRSFPVSQLFPSVEQSIGASASVLVFPMNIQG